MKNLIAIRHAKSSWDDASLTDRNRPLNERGKRDAPFMGKMLKSRGVMPELMVSSPAVRALKTAKLMAKEFGYPKERIVVEERIYLQGVSVLVELIQHLPDSAACICLFGHNPDVTDLVNLFTDEGIENIPTCGIASIQFAVDSWGFVSPGAGRMAFFDYPKRY